MKGKEDRQYWVDTMCNIAAPVLTSLANQELKIKMPVEAQFTDRDQYTYLEAFGRLLSGLSAWLETGPRDGAEGKLREKYAQLARESVDAATDPTSLDFMNFTEGGQPIVDAAFLAHAIVRAPNELYHQLSERVQTNLITCLKATRTRKPVFSNWLLFSAMIETALYKMGEDVDLMRIDYAIRQHEQWYVGDGIYSDGPSFYMDYYNSYVIQPMLVDIVKEMSVVSNDWSQLKEDILIRATRYGVIQERMISPEGTFPAVGRSLPYRFGAFQHLAQMALQGHLDESLSPAQVRCALTAVMKRMIEAPGTFDDNGWLTIGFVGHQPEVAEGYISTGSLYLCSTIFLPLGLKEDDPFWQGEEKWTAQKIWDGEIGRIDYGISFKKNL